MNRQLIITLILTLASTNVLADFQSDQAFELAQEGVVGTNASGDIQTTVVDENGNLKIVPTKPATRQGLNPSQGPRSRPAPQQPPTPPSSTMVQPPSGVPIPDSTNSIPPSNQPLENNGPQPMGPGPNPQAEPPLMLQDSSRELPGQGAPGVVQENPPGMAQPNPPGMSQ